MPELRRFFETAPTVPFRGTAYRISLAPHRKSMVSMRGAFLHGGRYNVRRYFGCLYTSLDIRTAQAEVECYLTVRPDVGLILASIRLVLSKVVDLTARRAQRRAGLRLSDLIGPHTVSQEIGVRAWESGIEALIVPSAAVPGASNLAVFLDNQAPGWVVNLRSIKVTAAPAP